MWKAIMKKVSLYAVLITAVLAARGVLAGSAGSCDVTWALGSDVFDPFLIGLPLKANGSKVPTKIALGCNEYRFKKSGNPFAEFEGHIAPADAGCDGPHFRGTLFFFDTGLLLDPRPSNCGWGKVRLLNPQAPLKDLSLSLLASTFAEHCLTDFNAADCVSLMKAAWRKVGATMRGVKVCERDGLIPKPQAAEINTTLKAVADRFKETIQNARDNDFDHFTAVVINHEEQYSLWDANAVVINHEEQ